MSYEMVGVRQRKSMQVEERQDEGQEVLLGARSFDVMEGLYTDTTWTRLKPWLIVAMLVVVIIFQIIVVRVPIWLGEMTNTERAVYTTGVTVLATMISAGTAGQIRSMWLKRFKDVKKAQVLLQIGNAKDQLRLYWLTVPLIVFSLITAAITGSTAIGKQGRQSSDETSITSELSLGSCWNTTDGLWSVDGRSVAPTNGVGCVESIVTSVYNMVQLLGFGYLIQVPDKSQRVCHTSIGGQVACSAIGAPLSTALDCNLFYSLGCQPATVCAPVFKKNPITCQSSFVDKPGNNTFKVDYFPTTTGDMTLSMATNDQDTGNILWTATDTPYDGLPDFSNNTFLVNCSFSLNDTIEFRLVTNSTVADTQTSQELPMPALVGGQSCTGIDILQPGARLTAGYLVYYLLSGAFVKSLGASGAGLGFDYYAFPNSKTRLEDYIGVQVATGMSYYWGPGPKYANRYHAYLPLEYTVDTNRIGSGKVVNVLYILPALCALVMVLWLWWTQ